jgi:hypothetical protein
MAAHVSRIVRVVASLLLPPLAATLLACSSDSDRSASASGTAPVIASLYLWPDDAVVNEGGGMVSVSYGVQVADPDADVARIVVTVLDAAGAAVSQRTEPVTNPLGATGTLGGQVAIPTTTIATYTIEVQAFDSGGAGSNVLRDTFSVVDGNPVPTVVSTSPASAAAGGAGFTLTVTGTGFMPTSTVRWDGYTLTATYVDATTVRAQVDSYRLHYVGTAQVTVSNPLPGGGTSAPVTFVIEPQSPNPVPTVTSILPTSVDAGGPSFALTVTGTGFVAYSRIVWNGSQLSTTLVDSSTLTATISSWDIATPRTASVSVYNPTPGGGTSSPRTFPVTMPEQPGVRFVSLKANDLVWDPYLQKIYVSVPGVSSVNPNTITVLDPFTGELTGSRFVGSEPDRVALSDDGQFLYVGLRGASSVERLTLPDLLQDLSIAMGRDATYGPYYAGDLRVAPASPRTLAVSLFATGSTSASGGMVIYDDATPRPTQAGGATGSWYRFDSLQWGTTASDLYASSASYGYDLYTFSVDASGVVLHDTYRSAFSTYGLAIRFDPGTGLLYADDGRVIDPATGLLAGTYPVSGLYARRIVPDSSLGSAFFVSGDSYGSGPHVTLSAYDLTQYYPTRSTTVSFVGAPPRRLIRWGLDGLAFLTPDLVVLLRGPTVLPASTTSNPVPVLTSISPSSATAGSPNLALAVTGTGFVRGSTVLWNGSERTTKFVSSTDLVAYVPASDVAAAGSAEITVASPSPGGGTSSAAAFAVNP